MNSVASVKMYITKMTDECGPGMKVLLMDKETTSIVSVVYGRAEIQQREVYLFERLDSVSREPLRHLKCIVFIRPTAENIQQLAAELRRPRYASYYIYLSNVTPKEDIKTLAEADEYEVVREVRELFADFLALGPQLFSLGLSSCISSHGGDWLPEALTRCVQGVSAVLLALRRAPVIRYQGNSNMARRLAESIYSLMATRESQLFEFRGGPGGAAGGTNSSPPPLLLIADRRDDPVTPLLTQWTYQAMVHELLSINNNRVNLAHVDGISADLKEVVLSAEHDEFYAKNLYLNFGEIGQTIKELIDDFQRRAKSHKKVDSVADMKSFIEAYPQFKKLSGTVSKHVHVVGELSALTMRHALFEVSEREQELACQERPGHAQRVKQLLANEAVRHSDAAKVVALYALRYEGHADSETNALIEALRRRGAGDRLIRLVRAVVEYGGTRMRQSELFGAQDAVGKITRRLFKDLRDVENVYTQHRPLLHQTLEDATRGRLRESAWPILGGQRGGGAVSAGTGDIIVFIAGGATYEEALTVHQANKTSGCARIILGGSTIHNSASFLEEVAAATGVN